MSSKRFLILGNQALSLSRFRGALLKDIQALGYDIHAVAPDFDHDPAQKNFFEENNITIHQVAFSRSGLGPVANLWMVLKLWRLMRQIKPDYFLGYTVKPVIWGSLAAFLARVPKCFCLITGLGYAFTGELSGKRWWISKTVRFLYRVALQKAHKVFFQNPDDQALFRDGKILPSSVPSCIVNGSGVDLAYYKPAPMPDFPLRFLMAARLLGDKGIHEYARSALIVRAQVPDIEFHLIGGLDADNPDGIGREEVDSWVQQGAIIWHGNVEDVRPFISECHVFVLPSYREGTPRAVLEAMAMARPIITTDVPGCRETVVHKKSGWLIPSQSVEGLVTACLECYNAPDNLAVMGQASLRTAQSKYAVHLVNELMIREMGLS